jgi:hypothetical protein
LTALVDPRGCLTPAGMEALQQAPPGHAPEDLARHVAGCARCQARLLAASTGRRGTAGAAGTTAGEEIPAGLATTRRLWRTVVLMAVAFFLAVVALAVVAFMRPA